MTSVRANPIRTIRVTARVARMLSQADIARTQTMLGLTNGDLVGKLFGHRPSDTLEIELVEVDELFVERRSIAMGIDVHIHVDVSGDQTSLAANPASAASVLESVFPDGDFCYLLTINHDVSIILLRTPERQEHREQEFSDTTTRTLRRPS